MDDTQLITVAASLARSGKVGIGASFAVNDVTRETTALIGNSIDNPNFAAGGVFTTTGALNLTAENTGFFAAFGAAGATASNDKLSDAKTAAAVAVGFAHNDFDETTQAYIYHADVTAGTDILISSTTSSIVEAFSIGGALSRGNTNSVSLAGAASVNSVKTVTEAFIKDSHDTVVADRRKVTSTNGKIELSAVDGTEVYSQAGAISIAFGNNTNNSTATRSLSIGASVAINDFNAQGNRVRAFIDNSKVTSATGLSVKGAAEGEYHALAVGGSASIAAAGSVSNSALAGAVAGAYAENDIARNVASFIQTNSVITVGNTGSILIDAQDNNRMTRADAFGIALAYSSSLRPNTTTGALAIGVGVAKNKTKNQIEAYIDNATVDAGRDIEINVDDNSEIAALGIGVAASAARGTGLSGAIAGAGSAAVNDVDNLHTSSIRNSGGTKRVQSSAGSITLSATDSVDVTGVAGTVALALGLKNIGSGSTIAVAAGVSVVLNHVGLDGGNTAKALIDNSIVTAANQVTLSALSNASIYALAAGGAGAVAGSTSNGGVVGALAGAGAGTENTIQQTIEAAITNGSVVTANNGNATLTATDSSEITADAGAVAVALAFSTVKGSAISGSIGIGTALNTLTNQVSADIDNSRVTARSVSVTAESKKAADSDAAYRIDALALGIAGSASGNLGNDATGALAGAGSGTRNQIDNKIQAFIKNSQGANKGVTATAGGVSVSARDDASIRADSGGIAIALAGSADDSPAGGFAAGVSVSLNNIGTGSGHVVAAFIDNASVTSTGPVSVTSVSNAKIDALAIAGALTAAGSFGNGLGVALAGAGVGTVNTIEMEIQSRILNNSPIVINNGANGVTGNLTVQATDLSTIDTTAVGVALGVGFSVGGNAGALGVGISVALNNFNNEVLAEIANSNVNAAGGTITVSASEDATIDATSVAASLAIAGSGNNALALSGGGSISFNTILSKANALITNSTINAGGNVAITSDSDAKIRAEVVGAFAGIGASGKTSAAAAIGAAVAKNFIGYDQNRNKQSSQIRAISENSQITTGGSFTTTATSNQDIDAEVVSVSVAIAASGNNAFGLGGSGVLSENKIAADIKAGINGDGTNGIRAQSVTIDAKDVSKIDAEADGVAVAIAATGSVAGTLTIGVALARNEIANNIEASIIAADALTTTVGGVSVTAAESANIKALSVAASVAASFSGSVAVGLAGAGAESTNVILAKTNAFIKDSRVDSNGAVTVKAEMTGNITAQVDGVAAGIGVGGSGGVGLAIGAGVTNNYIGFDEAEVRQGSEVRAFVQDSSITKGTTLSIEAKSNQTIDSSNLAVAVAIAGAADLAVGLSGAGVGSENLIGVDVKAFIDGDGASGINVDSVSVLASDTSTIQSTANAVSVAASFALVGVSASLGVALASNRVSNRIESKINRAANLVTKVGGVSVRAEEKASIRSTTTSSSIAASISIGGSAALSLTTAQNSLTSSVLAAIDNSSKVQSKTDVIVSATDTATLSSEIRGISIAVGLISLGVGLTLSDDLHNTTTSATITNSSITAQGGNVAVTATSTPTMTTRNIVGAGSFGLGIAGAGGNANTRFLGTTDASVSGSTITAAGRNVNITSTSTATGSPTILGVSGGLAAVAAMTSSTLISGTTSARLGGNSNIQASLIDVRASDTSVATPTTTIIGIGGVTGAGAKSTATINRTTEALVAGNANLALGATRLDLNAVSNSRVEANATGIAGGGIAVAILDIESTSSPITRAFVGTGATVNAGQLNIKSDVTSSAKSPTEVFGVGLLAGAGMELDSIDRSQSLAYIGPAIGTTSASPTTVNIQAGGVDLDAKLSATAESKTKTLSVGLLAVAGSKVNSEASPTTQAYLGNRATVSAPNGSVTLDTDSSATGKTEGSELAAGAIAVSFTKVLASTKPNVGVFTEPLASINALSGSLVSKSVTNLDDKIAAVSGGIIAASGMTSDAEINNRNQVTIGAGSILKTVNDLTLRTTSTNTGNSTSTNGSGGVVAVNSATANLKVNDLSEVNIRDNADIAAIGNLLIESLVSTTADANSEVNNGGFVASPSTSSVATINVSSVANFGTDINVRGQNVTLRAEVTKLDVEAKSKFIGGSRCTRGFGWQHDYRGFRRVDQLRCDECNKVNYGTRYAHHHDSPA